MARGATDILIIHEPFIMANGNATWKSLPRAALEQSKFIFMWKIYIKRRVRECHTKPFPQIIEECPLYKHSQANQLLNTY